MQHPESEYRRYPLLIGLSDPLEKTHRVLSSLSRSKSGCPGEGEQVPRVIIATDAWTALQKLAESSGKPQRVGELRLLFIQTRPSLPNTHISSLCLAGEERQGEAGAEVPVHTLEQQEAAGCAEPGGAAGGCQTVHAPPQEGGSCPAALQVPWVSPASYHSASHSESHHSALAWHQKVFPSMPWGVLVSVYERQWKF